MRTWITSRPGITVLTALIAIGSSLVIVNAIATQGVSARTVAAGLLAMSFVIFIGGGVFYAGRAFMKWQVENTPHLIWERGFVIVAVVATVLGLALLEDLLRGAGESILTRIGMVTYLFGAIVVVGAETAYLGKNDWNNAPIVLYVVLAFLAQAAFGLSLLQTGLVAGWAGWTTVIWNLGWLLIMILVRPRDIYFPVLHHVAPLVIGIALLAGR